MQFLADESCDGAVVRALRAQGHEVSSVSAFAQGAADATVMAAARADSLILLTEDKDFGHLIFALALPAPGVILIRWPVAGRREMIARMLDLVALRGAALFNVFAVVEPGGIRLRPRPRP